MARASTGANYLYDSTYALPNALTVLFWIKSPSTTATATFLETDGAHNFAVYSLTDGRVRVKRLFSGGQAQWHRTITMTSWTHVAISHDGTSAAPTYYVNGVKQSAPTVANSPSGTLQTGDTGLYVLNSAALTNAFGTNGGLAQIALYDRVLTDAEVANAFAGSYSNTTLQRLYPLESTNPVLDAASSTNKLVDHGTVDASSAPSQSWTITTGGGGGSHSVVLKGWQFYSDAADVSMTALAAENTAPTLTGAQMQDGIIRLRAQLHETGGVAGSGAITVQYGEDGSNWQSVSAQANTGTQSWEYFFHHADGAATAGATLASNKLTGTTAAGIYLEDTGTSVSVAANAIVEIDLALKVHWPPPDSNLKLRILYGGTALSLDTGASIPNLTTSPAAQRPYTITRVAPGSSFTDPRFVRFSAWRKLLFDGNLWWVFYVPDGDTSKLYYHSWDGNPASAWSAAQTLSLASDASQGRMATTLRTINGVPVVYLHHNRSGNPSEYYRGTISGTTITWSAATSTGENRSRWHHVAIDDDGRPWLGGINASSGIWVKRGTNVDTGTSWTAGFDATVLVADSGVVSGDVFALQGIGSNKVLAVWHNGTNLRSVVVTGATAGTVATVNASSVVQDQDWGFVRSGNYVYLVHTDSTTKGGNWQLRVFDITTETWSTGTDPVTSGQISTQDGILVASNGNDIYAFGTFIGSVGGANSTDRAIKYKVYSGPGTSGAWGPLTELASSGGRTNLDHITASGDMFGNKILLAAEANDDETLGTSHTLEYHYVSIVNQQANGSGNAQADPATASGTGTFTPVYIGTGATQAQPATSSAAGTFTSPVYTGSGSVTAAQATANGSGTATAPVYTGAGAPQAQAATAAGAGTFTQPVYTATGTATAQTATANGSGTFAPPVFTGSGNVQAAQASALGAGTFNPPGTVSGTGVAQADPATASGTGTFTPVYTAVGNTQAQPATSAGSGTFSPPTFLGDGVVSAGPATAVGFGTFSLPGNALGVGNAQAQPTTASGLGTFTAPVVTGVGSAQAQPATASGNGRFIQQGDTAVQLRLVEDTIKWQDGSPVVNATFTFTMTGSTTTADETVLPRPTTVTTDETGFFSVSLFCTSTGSRPRYYVAVYPNGEKKRFTLEPGDTPFNLRTVETAQQALNSDLSALYALLDERYQRL